MDAFKKFIKMYTELSENEWQIISQVFEQKTFHKNELILKEGSICRHFYFLESGLIRFFILHNGDDTTKFFTTAPFCFTSKTSFRQITPAHENIQALETTVVYQTTLSHVTKLLELKAWNTFTRNFMHEVQTHTEELLIEAKTETAEIRYQKLLAKYPDLIKKIPLRHLATFLGIAPQSLSRIRKMKIS